MIEVEGEGVTYRVDPCGECAEGKCDHCSICDWQAERFPSKGVATWFGGAPQGAEPPDGTAQV